MDENINFPKANILVLILLLNISCSYQKASNAETNTSKNTESNKTNTANNKLKFAYGIRAILHDSNGNYWFGSHREGVCLYAGKSFSYFTVEDGLSHNQVRRIQEDENGTIWFGTANGVSSFNGERIITHTLNKSFTTIESIKIPNWRLTENELWFNAGNNFGVYKYDGQKLTYLNLPFKGDNTNFYAATDFSKGKNQQWIATYGAVLGYDGKTFTIINDKSLGYSQKTGLLHVRSVFEDSQGRLWIGNNGLGVLLHKDGVTTNFSEEQGLIHAASTRNGAHSPPGTLEHVFAIYEDKNGHIWFGDRDNGAWRYDNKSMTNYVVDKNLETQMIWDIYEDKNGNLLFAMESGGVYKFNEGVFERAF